MPFALVPKDIDRLPADPTTNPPLTPLYDSLTTNVAHPLMAYPSFPFPPSTLLFPPASVVRKYLEDYADHFNLNQHVRLNTTVRSIDWDPAISKWRVRISPTGSSPDTPAAENLFDLVAVANGHYRVPYYPDTPGLRTWVDSGKATHSAWYRHAHSFGDTVLVVGGGPSGIDVADEMRPVSKTVIHSVPDTDRADSEGGAFKRRGRITEFQDVKEGRVLFEDGTSESGIDHCILATGYEHSLPFLGPSLLEHAMPPPIPPIPAKLYNSKFHIFPVAKQIFPLVTAFPPSSLALLVLPYRIIPFPAVEAQMRAVLKVFAEPSSLNPTDAALDVVSRYEELRAIVGDNEAAIARLWHKLEGPEQFDYMDDLHKFAGGEFAGPEWEVPAWVRELWTHKIALRAEWKDIVKAGEAEKWVAGVGEAGGEEGNQQWADLMRRVLRRGAERQAALEASEKTRL